MRALISITTLTALATVQAGCGGASEQQVPESSEALTPALELYFQNELDEALPLFQAAVIAHPSDAVAHAWVAETARRLRQFDLVERETGAALEIDPCNSFAHTVLGDAYRPELSNWDQANADLSWSHYQKAVECDPTDGNPWIGIWSGALNRGDRVAEDRALHELVETDFLTPSVLAFNRWILSSVPADAILITNGDWDTFPALSLQVVEGIRDDVGIVNRSLFNLPWYAELIAERYGVALPMSVAKMETYRPFRDADGSMVSLSDALIRGWMESGNASGRPLIFATTTDVQAFDSAASLQYAGAYWRLSAETVAPRMDVESVRLAIDALSGDDFSTPEVSPQDRSAIRRLAARNRGLTRVAMYTGIRYAQAMLEDGEREQAEEAVQWAEQFANAAGLSGEHRAVIERLKGTLQGMEQ